MYKKMICGLLVAVFMIVTIGFYTKAPSLASSFGSQYNEYYKNNMDAYFVEGSAEDVFYEYLQNNPQEAENFMDPLSNAFIEANYKFTISPEFETMNEAAKADELQSCNFMMSHGEELKYILEEAILKANGQNTDEFDSFYAESNEMELNVNPYFPPAITKAALRKSFQAAAIAMMQIQATFSTGALLNAACQDAPPDQYFGAGTDIVNKILRSPDFKATHSAFMKSNKAYQKGSMTLNSPIDLLLSLRKVDYAFRKSNYNVSITDLYDFNSVVSNRKAIRNLDIEELLVNYGALGMRYNAINDYYIYILFQYSGD